MIRTQGVEPYEGSVRYVRAARDAGLRRAVVSSSANCHDVLVAAGIDDLFEARIDGVVTRSGSTCAGSPPRTPSWPGPRPWGWNRRPRRCTRTPWPAWKPGGQAGSATWWGWTAWGRRTALKAHGADVVVEDLAELLDRS